MKKKFLSIFISIACLQTLFCASVFAAETTKDDVITISLGDYPQSEVTGDNLTSEIKNAAYDEEGYCEIQGTRYKRLGVAGDKDPRVFEQSYYELWRLNEEGSSYEPPQEVHSSIENAPISYQEFKKRNTQITDFRYFKCEPIKWSIVYEEDGRLLLMANQILDCQLFDDGRNVNRYLDKTLRLKPNAIETWLNESFLNQAFSNEQQKLLIKAKDAQWSVKAASNADTDLNLEETIFLPTYEQAENIIIPFMNKNDIQLLTTDYAAASGASDHNLMLNLPFLYLVNREIPQTLAPAAVGVVYAYEQGVCPVMTMQVKDNFQKGDVDYNGKITLTDANLTLKSALAMMEDTYGMDVNGDGNVNLDDARAVLSLALGI